MKHGQNEGYGTLDMTSLEKILGFRGQAVLPLGGGGNSRIYRISRPEGGYLAVKAYFRNPRDNRDRLGTEYGALRFLCDCGIDGIPKPVLCDKKAGLMVMQYIDGAKIVHPSDDDIEYACRFLQRLHTVRLHERASLIGTASEACFSLSAMEASVQYRITLLQGCDGKLAEESGLAEFLEGELVPAWKSITADCRRRALELSIPYERKISEPERTLSPSDFGFHNALRWEGKIYFLDFEYFGWDDPAKMVSDFLLHPGMELTQGQRRLFAENVLRLLPIEGLRIRSRLAYPLFGMKWCAILLNEFLPESLRRRQFAAAGSMSAEERQAVQLEKARKKLSQVLSENEHFTLFDAPF
jgi:hypothetical protein